MAMAIMLPSLGGRSHARYSLPASPIQSAAVSMRTCRKYHDDSRYFSQQSALGSFTGFRLDNRLPSEATFGAGLGLGLSNGSRWFMISHGRKVAKLNRPPDQRRALLRGLVTQLLRHGRIKTTRARAKAMRSFAEHMITLAKGGSLHQRRQALGYIYDKQLVHALFAEVPDRYGERNGGYTRIIRTMPRRGDNAPMSYIELV